jgi:catechol 2,3-dioxygenase-like lactoylglutathione lyase family enzyme
MGYLTSVLVDDRDKAVRFSTDVLGLLVNHLPLGITAG